MLTSGKANFSLQALAFLSSPVKRFIFSQSNQALGCSRNNGLKTLKNTGWRKWTRPSCGNNFAGPIPIIRLWLTVTVFR